MKRTGSQIVVAIVCALLGFLLAYQFKALTKQKNNNTYGNSDVLAQVDSLKKEKEELEETNASLMEDLKRLENSAAEGGAVETEIRNQLNNARMQLGLVDVKGPGVEITITQKTNIFSSPSTDSGKSLGELELNHLINVLWYAKAEAVSVNDIRITSQTGIKNASSWISISGAGRVDPASKIVIKAIGDKNKLKEGATFKDTLTFGALTNYNVNVEPKDDIIINKTSQSLKSEFLTPVE